MTKYSILNFVWKLFKIWLIIVFSENEAVKFEIFKLLLRVMLKLLFLRSFKCFAFELKEKKSTFFLKSFCLLSN